VCASACARSPARSRSVMSAGARMSAASQTQGAKMSKSAMLHCSCREVRGVVTDVSPKTVNRVVCYCDDCQAFLHQLARRDPFSMPMAAATSSRSPPPPSRMFKEENASSGCVSHPRGYIAGTRPAATRPSAIPSVRQFRLSESLRKRSRAKHRDPTSCSVRTSAPFLASMRSAQLQRARRDSICHSWRARSPGSSDGVSAGRPGHIPSSSARRAPPGFPSQRCPTKSAKHFVHCAGPTLRACHPEPSMNRPTSSVRS
jgi:hypothetical protein